MSGIPIPRILIGAAGAAFLAASASSQLWNPLVTKPAPEQASKQPKIIIRCIPPGTSRPNTPCAVAEPGSTVQLDTNLRGSNPPRVILISGAGKAVVHARPVSGSAGSYLITVPRHLCSGKDKLGNFQIQIATSDLNQAENKGGGADSLGYFQMRC